MNQKYEEFKKELIGKKIAIIGAGVSNLPLIKILKQLSYNITVFDKKELAEMEPSTAEFLQNEEISLSLGEHYLEKLIGFDIIFRSPSFLPTNEYLRKEQNRGALITTEIEQVIRLAPCPIIGVTGSKGKTTTATIIYNILKN
ncbi:MAG: hypothetical protein MR598_08900 [Erysipelotrichaceae bacterium]|nr:hypothetical protein [Erysipelotrichaceae bacterium]